MPPPLGVFLLLLGSKTPKTPPHIAIKRTFRKTAATMPYVKLQKSQVYLHPDSGRDYFRFNPIYRHHSPHTPIYAVLLSHTT